MKWAIRISMVLLLVGSTAMVADALVLTDEERLDGFADALRQDGVASAVLDSADTRRQNVELSIDGNRRVFGDGDEARLSDALHDALTEKLEDEIQRSVSIRGERATVAYRGETRAGLVDLEFRFKRMGDGWLMERARIRN